MRTLAALVLLAAAVIPAAAQNDAELSSEMFAYYLLLSDAPQELKTRVKQISENRKQAAQEQAQSGPPPEPLKMSLAIKSEFDIPIIVGGPHPTYSPDMIARCERIRSLKEQRLTLAEIKSRLG